MTPRSNSRRNFNLPKLPLALLSCAAIALFATFTLPAVAIGSATEFEETFEIEKKIAADRATIRHAHGNIEVHGWDRPDLRITGKKIVKASNRETAESYAKSIKVSVTESGGTATIETLRPKPAWPWQIRGSSVHYELFIPKDLLVDLNSSHGNVLLTQFRNGASVNTGHGNLSVEAIGKRLEVDHKHGNASIAEIEGSLKIEAKHGKLDVQSITGPLKVEHAHGHVAFSGIEEGVDARLEHGSFEASDLHGGLELDHEHGRVAIKGIRGNLRVNKEHGSLLIENAQGEVEIDVDHASARILASDAIVSNHHIEGDHSHIELSLPNANQIRYSLKTDHGRIKTTLPIQIVKGSNWQAATSQQGHPSVVVSTEHGNISFE